MANGRKPGGQPGNKNAAGKRGPMTASQKMTANMKRLGVDKLAGRAIDAYVGQKGAHKLPYNKSALHGMLSKPSGNATTRKVSKKIDKWLGGGK
jgi:hypothetical protein